MSYSMNAIVLSENDIILGSRKDLLVYAKGIVWEVALQLTQVNLRITFGKSISCLYV